MTEIEIKAMKEQNAALREALFKVDDCLKNALSRVKRFEPAYVEAFAEIFDQAKAQARAALYPDQDQGGKK